VTYVIAATYVVKDGEAEAVLAVLEEMTPLARAEPGCEAYVPHRSVEDPNVFFLYERYKDADAYKAHGESDHFERLIKGEAWPRLERRDVVRAAPLEDA
jgi:quinol monooxygenase YgiN